MNIDQLIEHLGSDNATKASHAFDQLHRNIQVAKDHVFAAARAEKDCRIRGALVELLGDSKDPKYLKFIASKLRYDVPEVKFWAFVALDRIATPKAIAVRDEYHFHDLVKKLRDDRCRR